MVVLYAESPKHVRLYQARAEGKNVNMLMPAPFSMQHHNFLRRFKQTQKGVLLGSGPREVIGLHKDGFVFPTKIAIDESAGAEGYTGVFHEASVVGFCHLQDLNLRACICTILLAAVAIHF